MFSNKILKILLVFFVGATLVLITAITIIIARGGQITPQGLITNTGLIRIHVDPENLDFNVYLNEEKKQVIDKRVNNITEGEYTVKIEADRYSVWEKKILIRKDLVTEIYVKLYPKELALSQVTKSNVSQMTFTKDGEYVYYVIKHSEFGADNGIWRLPISQNTSFFSFTNPNPVKLADLTDELSEIVSDDAYVLDPSEDNTKLVISNYTKKINLLLNATGMNKTPYTNLNKILGFDPDKISWFDGAAHLIIQSASVLIDYNVAESTSSLLLYKPKSDIIYSNNHERIFAFDSDKGTLLTYQNKKLAPLDIKTMSIPTDIISLSVSDTNNNILYINSKSSGYMYVNLEKLFMRNIFDTAQGRAELLEMNNDGTSAIFSIGEKFVSFMAIENLGTNMIETKLVPFTQINLTKGRFNYTPQSTHIVYYDKVATAIKAVERDGSNAITLLTDKGITLGTNFNALGDYLYLGLSENSDSTIRQNIYKIKLVQSQ